MSASFLSSSTLRPRVSPLYTLGMLVAASGLCFGCATGSSARTGEEAPASAPASTVSAPAATPPPAAAANATGTAERPAVPAVLPPRPLQDPAPMSSVVLPVENKPVISIRLVFHAGSVDDPPGKEGLTALTTSVMEQGGTKALSSSQLIDALFPIAGELGAQSDKELTTFLGRVHRDNLDTFLKIFTDVLLEPRFDEKEFQRLKSDHINDVENGLRSENDERLGQVALDALLFSNHPYRHYAGGTVQGLRSITLDDVKAHWKRVFTQDRLVVGLAGAANAELEARLKQRLTALPATGAPRVAVPPVPTESGRAVIIEKDTLSTAISMGYPWEVRRGDPDYYPLAAALSLLGEHRRFHGILFGELREKRGLNYGDYAYVEHFIQEGHSTFELPNIARSQQEMSIWIRPVEPEHSLFATRGALYFLNQLVQKGVPEDRFEIVRGFLLGYTRLREATDMRRLAYAIDDQFYGTPAFFEGFRHALKTMTAAQVNAAMRRHLSVERMSFAFVTKDAKALAQALHHQKPSPIEYPSPKPPDVLAKDQEIISLPIPISPEKIQIVPAAQFMER